MNSKGKAIQHLFFDSIRGRLPDHISMVHEISETLEISYDSAYRKMRGDKNLAIEEMKILSLKYGISIDTLFGRNNNDIHFQPFNFRLEENGFEEWLNLRIKEIYRINECQNKELIMVARDLPIFYYFDFPKLAAFKIYFWGKMLFHYADYHYKKFDISDIPEKLISIGNQLLSAYNSIASTEIWCRETFTRLIQQIEFCMVSGFFKHKNDAEVLFDNVEALIRHMQQQTELGYKFNFGNQVKEDNEENFRVYINEVMLIDNSVLSIKDGFKTILMTHNSLDVLKTTDPVFCNQIEHSLRSIMKTGNHISGTSGMESKRFFTPLFEKLDESKKESVSYRFTV